jgi:flagellin
MVSRGSSGEILITATEPGVPFTASSTNTGTSFAASTTEVVANAKAKVVGLSMNDLTINGVAIRATDANDDTNSDVTVSSSDRASSAIAMAAAINDSTSVTGVRAVPNPVVLTGVNTSVDNPPTGPQDLWVNGHKVTVNFDSADVVATRCKNVADAINKNLEGITAVSTDTGVTITAADGRNVSAWFDSTVQGLSAASFGLDMGGAKAQVSTVEVTAGAAAAGNITIQLNGQTITAALLSTDTTTSAVTTKLKSAIETAINTPSLGLSNLGVDIVGGKVTITSKIPGSSFDLRGVNTNATGVAMTLATPTKNDPGKNIVTGVNLSDNYKQNVLGGTQTYPEVKTAYGTLKLIAAAPNLPGLPDADGLTHSLMNLNGQPIRIETGTDGFNAQSNFKDLGFYEGIFGGRASVDMDPPRVGRLAFQVGSSANQIITIDLADFGKNGPITSGITGDVDQKLENRTVRINTRDGATQVLNLLDVSMDKINATRSTMGAVMNRLDHVINNLTNVSMNMSASRSQIEDADYASASTELAKTQIMQQAATAVLAQANTSQQSVMKLLGG